MTLVGLSIMIVSEIATLAHLEPFWSWNTPIAWTGFLLFADSVVWRARRDSWMRSAPVEFTGLAIASIPLWLAFELYNRFIRNWYYVGLPASRVFRTLGFAWSFATIWPAIFEGAELVAVWRRRERAPRVARAAPRLSLSGWLSVAVGFAMLVWPLLRPSRYLAAPVWLGFIFLLDPVNGRLGGESLGADFNRNDYDRAINLMLSGLLCGLLWEFWNYWARTKWHYTVPIMERVKLFEMPLPGFLGFPAFALECFTMYVFVRLVVGLVVGLVVRPIGSRLASGHPGAGRTIAL